MADDLVSALASMKEQEALSIATVIHTGSPSNMPIPEDQWREINR